MGVLDFFKGELLEIIEFNDESCDTLAYRWPDNDREIKRGAQLIVRESQVAQFMCLGQFGDTFGPGTHTLNTENMPVALDLAARYSEGGGVLAAINEGTLKAKKIGSTVRLTRADLKAFMEG